MGAKREEVLPLSWWQKGLVIFNIVFVAGYLVWRMLYTMNAEHPVYSWMFFGADVIGFLSSFCFAVSVFHLRSRTSVPYKNRPTVDVFIPTYNETEEILLTTIYHCVNLTYPHKTYVLDDGRRPEVEKLAKELGAEYIARPSNEFAKAGNLNYALERTKGDIVAIFDADGVPRKDFIVKLLGYFDDEKVALVQTPQTFYNIDSFQHMNNASESIIWHEQSLFFDVIQSGRDYNGAAMCCGSGSVVRRSALDKIGGFATSTVTEDLHTTLKFHLQGYETVYHPEPLAFCLAPGSVMPYIVQRGRWALGTVQMLRQEWRALFGPSPLTLKQRFSYLTAIYYFTAIQKMIYFVAPALYLIFGIAPIAGPDWILIPLIAQLGLSMANYYILSRGRARFFMTEVFFTYTLWAFLKSIAIGLVPRLKVKFRVTSKTPLTSLHKSLLVPAFLIGMWSLAGCAFGAWQIHQTGPTPGMLLAMSFSWLYFGIGMIAIYVTQKRPFSEEAYSFFDFRPLQILKMDGKTLQGRHAGVASIISEKALRFLYMEELKEGTRINVELDLPMAAVNIDAKVLRSRVHLSSGTEPIYEIDVGFEALEESKRIELIRYFFEDATPKVFAAAGRRKFKGNKGAEQRRHTRSASLVPIFVGSHHLKAALAEEDHYMGVLVDLSTTGARVKLPFPSEIGAKLEVQVPWAKSSLVAKVMRCTREENSMNPAFDVGLQFEKALELTHHEKLALKEQLTNLPTGITAAG